MHVIPDYPRLVRVARDKDCVGQGHIFGNVVKYRFEDLEDVNLLPSYV